jgi:Nucleotidyl transferase AbiEii toxin, Type IV TA system
MPSPRTYATAKAFRTALEERLKRKALVARVDLISLRRQVSFDRLLARLFREETAPWVLKGGYALELRFKTARSTVDIDLTLQRIVAVTSASSDANEVVRVMLQSAANVSLGDHFKFSIGLSIMDLTAAPYGGARYPRNSTNSRVKDLVDMALLIGAVGLNKQRPNDALRLTFERRGTHDLPARLIPPPSGLANPVAVVFAGVQGFLEEARAESAER